MRNRRLDLYIEDEYSDNMMLRESVRNYDKNFIDFNNRVCLDLGAHIGGFTKIALNKGARFIYSVECNPRNFQILSKNFEDFSNVIIINKAVCTIDDEIINLYKTSNKLSNASTRVSKDGGHFKEFCKVETISINKLLEFKPQIIKIDIEGEEYNIIDEIYNYEFEVLFIEFHVTRYKSPDSIIESLKFKFNNYNISPIIYFGGVRGYDCVFYN